MALVAQMLRLADTNSLGTVERKLNGDLKNFLKLKQLWVGKFSKIFFSTANIEI